MCLDWLYARGLPFPAKEGEPDYTRRHGTPWNSWLYYNPQFDPASPGFRPTPLEQAIAETLKEAGLD